MVTSRRTRSFHHYTVGGDLEVEDIEVLDETVEEVTCRWCGHGNAVETLEAGAIAEAEATSKVEPAG